MNAISLTQDIFRTQKSGKELSYLVSIVNMICGECVQEQAASHSHRPSMAVFESSEQRNEASPQ